ncbi:MAG: tetratricopeptide repeat protein [Candidatus Latescibacteria bacterium]|nr:tetratricopeptide repeat protein [Candidatus Latescibacterota bacterium]
MEWNVSRTAYCMVLIAVFSGCAKTVKQPTEIDNPGKHYTAGMEKLDGGDLDAAEKEFTRSMELDKRSPYGHTGMAFLELRRGNYRKALKHAGDALKNDAAFSDAHAAWGYALAVRRRRGWFGAAESSLMKAVELNPENQRALYYLGECRLISGRYGDALKAYDRAKGFDGPFSKKAAGRFGLVEKIIAAAPLSVEAGDIVLKDTIDRADLCVLLSLELEAFERLRPVQAGISRAKPPSDVNGNHWKRWILDVARLSIAGLSVFPNGCFYPDRPLTRAQCAEICQDIIVRVSGDGSLVTRYLGGESPYPDVRPDYYAFNAIRLCVEKGILGVREGSNSFDYGGTISGIEAVTMLKSLDRVLESYR